MKSPDFDHQKFRQLLAGVLEGRLDEAERQAFNQMLAASAEARREYRAMMDLHARLHLEYTGGREADFMPDATPTTPSRPPVRSRPAFWPVWIAAAAAIALFAVLFRPSRGEAQPFATLATAASARWGSGDLPTREGARLGHGTLKLEEGLALIRFDSGAEVSLEAPVELQIIDAMNCRITYGTAVANVPESATGFRVGTPSAMVIDYGTRFAVSVDPASGGTRTQVFEGLVDVENPTTGARVSLKSGQRASVQGDQTGPVTEGLEERFHATAPDSLPSGRDWLRLAATKDAYVGYSLRTDSEELLYVKNSLTGFHRKAYLGFDLSGIDASRIKAAGLHLQFEPTGLGLATHVPDATFAVYGLASGDQPWDENHLYRHTAPANNKDKGDELVADEVRKLGSFVVPQGIQRGRFGIDGETLAVYLREHAGSTITLIVVRETIETNSAGLVHGIASHRHPVLPAPTLAIQLRPE
jgi:hypothetical protein